MAFPVAMVSYAAAAAAFLFLFLLLIASWRGRLPGMLLALGSVATVAWAGATAYLVAQPVHRLLAAELLEVVRSGAWLLFLLVLVGYTHKQTGLVRGIAVGLALFCGALIVVTLLS